MTISVKNTPIAFWGIIKLAHALAAILRQLIISTDKGKRLQRLPGEIFAFLINSVSNRRISERTNDL